MSVTAARRPPDLCPSTPAPVDHKRVAIAGHRLVTDSSGALYWPEERLLIVADLHLEKGSAYASRGVFLPPYDTTVTLARLAEALARFAPRRIVALGDSFHDRGGASRLLPHDVQALRHLQTGRDWIWIAGNHDPDAPVNLAGTHLAELSVGPLTFRHEPSAGPIEGEVAGHLHPVALVSGRGGSLRRRCFIGNGARLILPAFGAYAGGLNIRDPAFVGLFGPHPIAHVLGREAVYAVAHRRCQPEMVVPAWRV